MILVYIISSCREEAESISIDLLEKNFVYSVNIIPDVLSMRKERDKIIRLERTIVLAKTKSSLYPQIEEEVKKVETSGTAIVFSMPITQMSGDLFDNIQSYTLSK